MADRTLTITWGEPVRGREERALEVFNDALGMLGRFQQEGLVESFDVVLNAPDDLGGYMLIKGTAQQIYDLRNREDFQRNTADAQISVERIRHIEGVCNEGIAQQMAIYNEAIAKVPQLH